MRKSGLSYTAPNFPLNGLNQRNIKELLNMAENAKITVVLDWLTVRFQVGLDVIPAPETTDADCQFEAGGLSFHYAGHGNQQYKYVWKIYQAGEHLATLLSHTRNEKFVRQGICKVDFRNHLFYSGQIWQFYDQLVSALALQFRGISRLDIAIDGVNYLMELCNIYAKQTRQNKIFEFIGKGRIDNKVLDRNTMMYQNFKLGSPKSGKELTIYNKSLEIVKSRKDYIQQFWKANGVTQRLIDIETENKRIKETGEAIYLEGYQNVFRIELRLNGKSIKETSPGIDPTDILRTADGLMSIFKLHTKQFFDAVFLDNAKTTRCTPIVLLPFHKFNIIPLKKIRPKPATDIYKAKLSINKTVKQLYTGVLSPDNASAFEMLLFDITTYDLTKWFARKHADEWQPAYSAMNINKTHVGAVAGMIETLIDELPEQEDD